MEQINLDAVARKHRDAYLRAQPFPHTVIDDLLPEEVLRDVVTEFAPPARPDWFRFDNGAERKLATAQESDMGLKTRFLLYQLNSGVFLKFLEALTGVEELLPDPYFFGGGLHQIEAGGFLKIHADFNQHPSLSLNRRLNLLLYLNDDWKEEYGGHLELWDQGMTRCEQKILPIFNRIVIFNTDETSFHGHPEPLTCPPGMTRKSLALYYYTVRREGRPSQAHSTVFQRRPGERYQPPESTSATSISFKRLLRKVLPPLVFEVRDHFISNRQPGS